MRKEVDYSLGPRLLYLFVIKNLDWFQVLVIATVKTL